MKRHILKLAAGLAACSIDESGLLSGDAAVDAHVSDASTDVVLGDAGADQVVPPVCTTLDASCLGVALPSGWEPFAMQVDASTVACPGDGGAFTESSYQANPMVVGNSCVCTACSVSTGWDCSGSIGVDGTSCNGTLHAEGDTTDCWSVTGTSGGGTITRTGTATCAASTYFATTASATPVAGCAPTSCTADFCGLAKQGFKLCARNAAVSDGGCPQGLPVSYVVGANPHASCNACPTCTITNEATATCTATLTGYTSSNCTTGVIGSVAADGTCHIASFNSVGYQPTVPLPTCSPTGPTNVGGTGLLDSPMTVCCTN